MIYSITPRGTATGMGWEYQLERDGHFTAWVPYPVTFVHDPEDGNDIRTGVTYWLYGRNPTIKGVDTIAAPVQVTLDGRVVSVDETGAPKENTPTIPISTKITDLFSDSNANDLDRDAVSRAIIKSMKPETLALLAGYLVKAFTTTEFELICAGLSGIGCSGKTVDRIGITGPNAIDVQETGKFFCIVFYEDGSSAEAIGAIFSVVGTGAIINASTGELSAGSDVVIGGAVTVKATYKGQTYSKGTVFTRETNTVSPGNIIYLKPSTVTVDPAKPPVLAGNFSGTHENAACSGDNPGTGGWLANLSNLDQMPEVDVYLDDVKVATVQTFKDRDDVAGILKSANNDRFGWFYLFKDSEKKGKTITVTAKIKGTNTLLTGSPLVTDMCPNFTPTVKSRNIVGPSNPIVANEGGLGIQLICHEVYTNDDVRSATVDQWRMQSGAPAVVSISSTGVLVCGNGLSNTVTVGVEAVVAGNVVQASVQLIKAGCTRNNAGFINPKLVYNFVQNGVARLFDSIDDANNTMGAHFDGTSPGAYGEPYLVQLDPSYKQGSPIWLGGGTDCTKSSDGIRYVLDGNGNNSQFWAIRIENGLIAEAKASTYQTTVVPPYEYWIGGSNDFSEDLTSNELPLGYLAPHGGQFAVNNGILHQTQTASGSEETISVVYIENGSDNRLNDTRILAKIRATRLQASDSRLGVGLNHSSGDSGGVNFMIRDSNTVGFLLDHIAFGPTFAFSSQANKWYWFAMKVEAGSNASSHKYSAKIWAEGTPEPSNWPFVWDNLEMRSGYPALILGNRTGLCTADCDEWYYSKQMPL